MSKSKLYTKRDLSNSMEVLASTGEGLVTGILYRCVRTVVDDESIVPTAGVAFQGGKFHLICNSKFMGDLDAAEQLGILMHEAMHLVFQHVTTRKQPDPKLHVLHNYATDCAINSLITKGNRSGNDAPLCKLPRMGLLPGRSCERPPAEKWAEMTPEQRGAWQKMSDFIEALPVLESSEWYFQRFLENQEIREMLEQPSLAEILEGMLMDDHDGWGEMSDEEREAAEAKMKEILARVVNDCQKTGTWGSVSAEAQEMIRLMLEAQVDWRKQFRNWIGMTRRGNRASTWKKPNKRCPGRMASSRMSWVASILTAVDESGSVRDSELEEIFAELVSMSRRRSIDILPFDHEVHPERMQRVKKKGGLITERTLCGGTNFGAVMEYAKKNRKDYDGVIICTDGEAADPGPPLRGQRRLWLITSRGNLLFNPHPGDTVIKLSAHKGKK